MMARSARSPPPQTSHVGVGENRLPRFTDRLLGSFPIPAARAVDVTASADASISSAVASTRACALWKVTNAMSSIAVSMVRLSTTPLTTRSTPSSRAANERSAAEVGSSPRPCIRASISPRPTTRTPLSSSRAESLAANPDPRLSIRACDLSTKSATATRGDRSSSPSPPAPAASCAEKLDELDAATADAASRTASRIARTELRLFVMSCHALGGLTPGEWASSRPRSAAGPRELDLPPVAPTRKFDFERNAKRQHVLHTRADR